MGRRKCPTVCVVLFSRGPFENFKISHSVASSHVSSSNSISMSFALGKLLSTQSGNFYFRDLEELEISKYFDMRSLPNSFKILFKGNHNIGNTNSKKCTKFGRRWFFGFGFFFFFTNLESGEPTYL